MDKWALGLSLLCVLAAAIFALIERRRTKRTMDTIEGMLAAAIEGQYAEQDFDESRLSALEAKFAHYFSSSALSANNVAVERDKIKTLIADISHQTKTPIANILLYSDLIAEANLSEDLRFNVQALQGQAEKLRFLIDALVKLSRMENGILTVSPKRQPVQPMLEDTAAQFVPRAEARGLKLSVTDTPVSACFDRKWTAEALGNIVDNAIKYTPAGTITVSAAAYEMFVRVDVTDTGVGIPEAEQARVFARFYRGERARDAEGVGIGLYLACEIVSAEGGYIKVVSAPGQGSTFSVFLPR